MIGHSMGGKIALSLAAKPYGLKELVLIAPSPPTPEPIYEQEPTQLLSAYNNPDALKKIINNITHTPLTDVELITSQKIIYVLLKLSGRGG